MTGKLPFKLWDLIIILLAAVLICFSAYSIYVKPQSTARVLIKGTDDEWIFPLEAEETVMVPGPLGNTIIRISNSEAWVESSPCKNQVCVASGHIHGQGAWAACLPNNVLIVVEGDERGPDATAW